MKVVIIGGGIIGLTCAYYLQKKGHEVVVIDKGDFNTGCSFGNAGYVSPSHFTPLASPGIIAQGLKWMLSSRSPFYIKPRLNADLLRWGLAFRNSANKQTLSRNAPHLNNLLQLSRELTSEIHDELGQFLMEEKGCFMLYKTAATEHHEIELTKQAAAFNIETRVLSAAEVQQMEPEVEVTVRGGVLYPIDAHIHPGEYMQAMRNHLKTNGVTLTGNAQVRRFEVAGDKLASVITDQERIAADEVVFAAGSWLPQLTRMLGFRLLLQPGKGYSMTFQQLKNNLHYPAILVDDRVAMTPLRRDLRIGGTMEISGVNDRLLINRVQAIYNAAKKYYPTLEIEFPSADNIWSGLRPLSPDGLPYIGRHSKYSNLVVAGGHAMLGVSLAAGTGKLVEEMISKSNLSLPVTAFAVERFQRQLSESA